MRVLAASVTSRRPRVAAGRSSPDRRDRLNDPADPDDPDDPDDPARPTGLGPWRVARVQVAGRPSPRARSPRAQGSSRTASAMTNPLAALLSSILAGPAVIRYLPSDTQEPPRGSVVPGLR